jgi:hypothetical protein
MARTSEAPGVVELGPLRTASLEESVKVHFFLEKLIELRE